MNRTIMEITAVFIGIIFFGMVIAVVLNSFSEIHDCEGTRPIGEGVVIGNDKYNGMRQKKWSYTTDLNQLDNFDNVCLWTCEENYKKEGIGCTILS